METGARLRYFTSEPLDVVDVTTTSACASRCDADTRCLSYEFSATAKTCKLNADADPTDAGLHEDFAFCTKAQGDTSCPDAFEERYGSVEGDGMIVLELATCDECAAACLNQTNDMMGSIPERAEYTSWTDLGGKVTDMLLEGLNLHPECKSYECCEDCGSTGAVCHLNPENAPDLPRVDGYHFCSKRLGGVDNDAKARTEAVLRLREHPHYAPDEPAELVNPDGGLTARYRAGLATVAAGVAVAGGVLLLIAIIYVVVACKGGGGGDGGRPKAGGGGGGRPKARPWKPKGCRHCALAVSLVFICVGCALGFVSEVELRGSVDNVQAALDDTSAALDVVDDHIDETLPKTLVIADAASDISCVLSGVTFDANCDLFDFTTLQDAIDEVVEMYENDLRSKVNEAQRQLRDVGQRAVRFVNAAVIVPFAAQLICGVAGLALWWCGYKRRSRRVHLVGVWVTVGIGLPAALVCLILSVMGSLAVADFCYVGPTDVLMAGDPTNEIFAYYLRCEGPNPLDFDIGAMDAAVAKFESRDSILFVLGAAACSGIDEFTKAYERPGRTSKRATLRSRRGYSAETESRRRRGYDVDIPWRRLRRGYSRSRPARASGTGKTSRRSPTI